MGATDRQSTEGCFPKEAWLIRFGDKDWRDHLRQWAQDYKFHATLPAKLDRAEADWHVTQPPNIPPPIIDADELRIRAPWTEQ